jgi:3',5'-nucleoside bisphosphate phosphatase
MIDLHLHTTHSDGLDTPEVLAAKARAAGLTVIAATDHDTMDGVPALERAAAHLGLRCVPGIEITASHDRKDVHVLGYFLDYRSPALARFIADQRLDRIRRARVIGERLASLDAGIDIERVIEEAGDGPVCRPAIAQVLVDEGRVATLREAFDRYIGEGKPAYVPRLGVTTAQAVTTIVDAGGIASLAHPGRTHVDELIPALVEAGLGALEVYHTDHTLAHRRKYRAMARAWGLAMTGGSDYHGDPVYHAGDLGGATLPAKAFDDLSRRPRREAV